ncbi:MAG: hypothetical protein JRG96_21125, partial [Deltaproteobacteria bacterium]|nr:hypothetical protein [Deltaproteobacteria bacterium]
MTQGVSQAAARNAAHQVWLLAAIGLLGGAITLGIFGWTLRQIASRGEQVEVIQSQLTLLVGSAESGLARLHEELAEHLSGVQGEAEDHSWLSALQSVVEDARGSAKDAEIQAHLARIDRELSGLTRLRDESRSWGQRFAETGAEMALAREATDAALHRIRASLASAEGRQRLQRVIAVRRYRAAQGEAASALASEIIEGLDSSAWITAINHELADLALLTEQLAGEVASDRLTDLKDNRFTPSLARLRRELAKLDSGEA